jgi:signal transduction histidine kinase/ActR/RegA family two-component response regulator
MIDTYRESKPVENSISRAADKKNQYYSLLYAEMAERQRVEENLRRSNLLLQAVSQAQLHYVAGVELTVVFSSLLRTLLTVTLAKQGYLREQNLMEDRAEKLPLLVVETSEQNGIGSEEFALIADRVLTTGRPVLLHPSALEMPDSLFPSALTAYYLGLPITAHTFAHEDARAGIGNPVANIVGVMVLAGNADDFDPSTFDLMQPLVATCAQLIVAQRNDQRRRAAEKALAEERVLLAQRVAERTAELSDSNVELARAARAKDEFLATMNHELRTPLNAVLLYAESLQTQLPGPLNARQLRAVGGIRESANHLLLLINDILDVAKMDAGKLSIDIQPYAVESICQSSLHLVAEMAKKKNIEVHLELDQGVVQVDVDERRLKQMLVNLLSNAIKFTADGGQIGLEVRADGNEHRIHFAVWDTGVGIAAGDLGKLFQPFVQLDSSLSRQHSGTGLGLYLVYRMAELHGGSVTVSSERGKGSRFTISLPWHPVNEIVGSQVPALRVLGGQPALPGEMNDIWREETGEETVPLAPRTVNQPPAIFTRQGEEVPCILLADDNETNLGVLSDFLHEWNCRLLYARNGVEAVRQTREHFPDLVLMDIQMPEMNGLDAIRMIRADSKHRHTPIVAVTALAMPGDREQCIDAGADDYLSKPIHIERLTEMLNRYLVQSRVEELL